MIKQAVLILFLTLTVLLTQCTGTDSDIYARITFRCDLTDNRTIVWLEVDNSLSSNYIRNINNKQEYDVPLFVNSVGSTIILKGVYMIAFDGTAHFADGSTAKVRYTGNSSIETAIQLLDDDFVILNLDYIK